MSSWMGSLFQAPGPPSGTSTGLPTGTSTTLPSATAAGSAPARAAGSAPARAAGSVSATSTAAPATSTQFATGEIVEYFSTSTQVWISAKVLQMNSNGTYNLDCKANVAADKIRKHTGSASYAYTVGEMVEYFSASSGNWIPAKVNKVYPQGTYDLDCKSNVPGDKIRKSSAASKGSTSAPGGAPAAAAPGPQPQAKPEPMKLSAPVQLVRVTSSALGGRSRYEVCSDGVKALESWGTRRISVASMCGPVRSGKSYLLNMLLERVQKKESLFKVGSTTQPCTDGLWLWGSADPADKNSPVIAYLDCEGVGSGEKKRDAQLMSLCGLLSSVLMLNTKGALNEGTFDQLAACNFGDNIEEHGNEANRPQLIWVLRDFTIDRGQSADQYLEQALQSGPSDGSGGSKEVRSNLLRFFGRRSCVALVQPVGDNSKLSNLIGVPQNSLRGEFRSGVDALRAQLQSSCKGYPKAVGGQALGCLAFVALLRKLVEALNSNKSLHVKGVWETVQHTACGQVADDIRGDAHTKMRALASGQAFDAGGDTLPLSDEQLQQLFQKNRKECRQTWEEKAVGDEHVRNEYWREIEDSLTTEEKMVRQQNTRTADTQLSEALKPWQEWLDSDDSPWDVGSQIARDLGAMMERFPGGPLSRAALGAIEAAGRRVDAVRGSVASAMKDKADAHRRATEISDQAARHKQELLQGRERFLTLEGAEKELEQRKGELEDAKVQIRTLLADIEAKSSLERDAHRRADKGKENEESLRLRLEEEIRAREKLHRDHHHGREKYEADLDRERTERKKLHDELDLHKDKIARVHQIERDLHDARADALEKRRVELDLEDHKRRLEEKERHLAEKDETHRRTVDLHQKELELEREKHGHERRRLERDLEENAGSLGFSRTERGGDEDVPEGSHPELHEALAKAKADHEKELESVRELLGHKEKILQETHKSLEETRQAHNEGTQRVLDQERNAGNLQGQNQELTAQNKRLQDRVHELEDQVKEAEHIKGQYKKDKELAEQNEATIRQLRSELDEARGGTGAGRTSSGGANGSAQRSLKARMWSVLACKGKR